MMHGEVVILSAVRTAVGKYGGSLKDIPPTELAATVTREAVQRSGLEAKDFGGYSVWPCFRQAIRI